MTRNSLVVITVACAFVVLPVEAQSVSDMVALKGLAPVTILSNSNEGKAALAANYTMTGGIQTGAIPQSTLLPFPEQQQLALRDAFITSANLAELADGLGTTLGAAYLARAHYNDQKQHTNLSPFASQLADFPGSGY